MRNFFITGLPRSRTSWFASFMTSGDIFCWHEAMNGCYTKEELARRMSLEDYSILGNSDSGLPFTDFVERFPDAPVVVIRRDIEDVWQSLLGADIADPDNYNQALEFLEELDSRLDGIKGLHVQFDDIDNRIEEIYRYCTGRQPDANRIRLFKNMNIEPREVIPDIKSYQLWLGG